MKKYSNKYDVALSFAEEDRSYAETLANLLQTANVSVFYDSNEQSELWGEDLYTTLADIYSNQSMYCVMFLSKHYEKKIWTNHERRFAQERALNESRGYILPIKLDDTDIPGIPSTIGYIDLRKTTIENIFRILIQKIESIKQKSNELSVNLFTIDENKVRECIKKYNDKILESPSDNDSLFMLGKSYLRLKLYDFSIRYFDKSLELVHDDPDYYYYFALSLIKGRRIKSLGLKEIKKIEELINTAIKLDKKSKYYYLSAIIKHDYYELNGLSVPGENCDLLLFNARNATHEHGEVEIMLDNIILRDEDLKNIVLRN